MPDEKLAVLINEPLLIFLRIERAFLKPICPRFFAP
jgi:hypothetical protein